MQNRLEVKCGICFIPVNPRKCCLIPAIVAVGGQESRRVTVACNASHSASNHHFENHRIVRLSARI
jgi:hypothetical protein